MEERIEHHHDEAMHRGRSSAFNRELSIDRPLKKDDARQTMNDDPV
jgi:hypothetical protein